MRFRTKISLLLAALPFVAGTAHADLSITEIWPGGLDGDENTSDWIEVTNLGDTGITSLDAFHYRDTPVPDGVPDGLPLNGGQLTGVSSLAPGESAVFLVSWEDPLAGNANPTLSEALDAFRAMWGFGDGEINLGWMLDDDGLGGPGLSRDGDSVLIYNGSQTGANVITTESFPFSDRASWSRNPETGAFGELSVAGQFGAREGLLPGSDSIDLPPIGSPGVYVPSPGAAALLCLAGVTALRRRG